MTAWNCDCGADEAGADTHAASCSSHKGRCCDCCQTHVDPHKGCWTESSASLSAVVSGTTVKEQQ